jgi:indole-3-glycerol phosphate synthase
MSVLSLILAAKLEEVERLRPREADLRKQAAGQPPAKPFATALRAGNNVALIAEFKRRSPSAGWIRQDGSVAEITKAYSESGARAISVLTDTQFFAGVLDDLRMACDKTSVPVLRKDFVIDELQLVEARAAGADAALLIVRILDNAQLVDLIAAARDLKFATLVEAHDRALKAGADIIGINNRDLARFEVNHELAPHMAQGVPPDIVLVAESGVRSSEDVARIGEAGIDAVLVGETLMRAPDPRRLVLELSSQPRARRQ